MCGMMAIKAAIEGVGKGRHAVVLVPDSRMERIQRRRRDWLFRAVRTAVTMGIVSAKSGPDALAPTCRDHAD